MRRRHNRMVWLATGLAAGTAMGWLSAPRRGDWLRNQIRQKLARWSRRGQLTLYKRGRDVEHRVAGGLAEVRQIWRGRARFVDANTLVDQVLSQLGRAFSPTLAHVNVNAVGHTIYLHGHVATAQERDRLAAAIRSVQGVGDVVSTALRIAPARRRKA